MTGTTYRTYLTCRGTVADIFYYILKSRFHLFNTYHGKTPLMPNNILLLRTIRNHYFPQCLIRRWGGLDSRSEKLVWRNTFNVKDVRHPHSTLVSTKQILFRKAIYTNNTESLTGKDDCELAKFIQNLEIAIQDAQQPIISGIIHNDTFLQLVFKLFCRQPSLNDSIISAIRNALLEEPYLNCGVNNPLRQSETSVVAWFTRWVNANCLLPGQHDISVDYRKAKFTIGLNQTATPFILPDNTKTLLLPLTPYIIVKLDLEGATEPSAAISPIFEPEVVVKLNNILLKNCDSYYISRTKLE